MKKRFFGILLLVAILSSSIFSQSKLDTVLMNLPAESTAELELYMSQLAALGPSAIPTMAQQLKNRLPGKFDLKEHYALSGLAKYAGESGDEALRNSVEEGFVKAIDSELDLESEVFLIEQLRYIATDKSLASLASKIKSICEPAIQTIASIESEKALNTLLKALEENQGYCRLAVIKAIGGYSTPEAIQALIEVSTDRDVQIRRVAAEILAESTDSQAFNALMSLAKTDPTLGNRLLIKNVSIQAGEGKTNKIQDLTNHINATGDLQQKTRCIELQMMYLQNEEQKNLQKLFSRGTPEEQMAIVSALKKDAALPLDPYFKYFDKVPAKIQSGLLSASAVRNYKPAISMSRALLTNSDPLLKIEAIRTLSRLAGSESLPDLQKVIVSEKDPTVLKIAISELGHWVGENNLDVLPKILREAPVENKAQLIDLIADRKLSDQLPEMESYLLSSNAEVRKAAFNALPSLASGATVTDLMPFISIAETPEELELIQKAFSEKASEHADVDSLVLPLLNTFGESSPTLLSKILPAIGGNSALAYIKKQNIQSALLDWKHPEAIPELFKILAANPDDKDVFGSIVKLINHPELPVDQRVLYLRKILPFASNLEEKKRVIQLLGNTRSQIAFMVLRDLLNNDSVKVEAARSLVNISLPPAGEEFGLIGKEIKAGLMQADTILDDGADAYTTSILRRYLSIIPEEGGFKSLFNGKDLAGWQGLVENPIARDTMFAVDLLARQIEADAKIPQNWKVEDGAIVFFGEGYDNLCTVESYRDFELLVDWKITKNGDSGIYLRGSPQVQIWDTSMTDIGAEVGSGGLYNNQENESKPLVVADNAVGEWNTFRIIMIQDKVTVYLNGTLVTDRVTLENYWNRELPIFRSGPIELQAHGTNLQFRDIYIREIESAPELNNREKSEGYTTIFNGINLDGWVGNKTDYIVKDGEIVIYPGGSGGHGNLYTEKEYDNFIIRFEFKLTPGANNGLGIHAPLEGDAAYVGKEIQILDNSSPIYANLKDYQYHGSVYGLVPAAKGALKPVGEWNSEEVRVKGNQIWVTVNNKRIVFDDLDTATRNGTLDGKEHPGLKRLKGHIGFLGHGSEVHFRNIRIKEEN